MTEHHFDSGLDLDIATTLCVCCNKCVDFYLFSCASTDGGQT